MVDVRWDKEVKAEHLRVLGKELGTVYHALCGEVLDLHAKWEQYSILYCHSRERMALLNRTAWFFFRLVQRVLWEDMILHLARLTDPPDSPGGKTNLSLLRLQRTIQEHKPELYPKIAELIANAQQECGFARDWRNRYLAHRDLPLAFGGGAKPLPEIRLQNMDGALSAVRAIMAAVQLFCFRASSEWTSYVVDGGAERVISRLEAAAEANIRHEDK